MTSGFEKEHFVKLLETLYSVAGHLRTIETELHATLEDIDEFYNWLGPILDDKETSTWNPSNIPWVTAQSASGKGPYERYPLPGAKAESTPDYHGLLADLKAHDGKLMRNHFFYWLFEDGGTVGRKRKGKA